MMEKNPAPASWDDLEGVVPPAQSLCLLGHDAQLATLARNYRERRLHHAWLLSGPKGIGKATLAFRFAEHLLRYREPENAPQDVEFLADPVHSQVAKGAHPNVLVIRKPLDQKTKKFKTRITVDEVRRTAAFLNTASGANAWRIVIVDPADDMNASAANALLKILEEPPSRTLFFILAHSPRGLLPTIRSRCQVMALKPLSDENLMKVLRTQPITAELSDDEIGNLVRHAKGSVRRAVLMARSGVLDIFAGFLELVSEKQSDIGQLHRLAGMLVPAAKSSEYNLFMDLVYDHIADQTRDMAANDQVTLSRINRWADVWDRTRESVMRAETWNMDKKQVILDLYRDMRGA